jgi:predicted dehydrogenase
MRLRVGLFGCGRIASFFHAPILAARGDVEVVAIADGAVEARDRVGMSLPGAVRFADWRTALQVADLDAAVICLPPALHAPVAIAAFEAGLHVYVEKPLALSLGEADAMIAAWRAAGTAGMVGFNFRFHPLIQATRARLGAGELGEIVAVRTMFTSARRVLPGWKADPRAGGGALADLATHHFDLVAHLTGRAVDPASIRAAERREPGGAAASVIAALDDGAPVQMLAAQTTGHSTNVLEVLGERGHLTIDLVNDLRPRTLETPPGRLARAHRLAGRMRLLAPRELAHAPGREPSFARALGAFVSAARTGTRAEPDLDDGRRAVALVLAAERAAASGATLRAAS